MAFLDPILNPLVEPLLNQSPFGVIFALAFVVSLVITLAYKYLTDQDKMKSLKDQQKEYQKRMKGLRDQPDQMMKVQKEAMKLNGQYMKMSLKPTLITMLPILLIFGWMSANLAFAPILPGIMYTVESSVVDGYPGDVELIVGEGTTLLTDSKQAIKESNSWNLKSEAGEHILTFKLDDEEQIKKVLVTKDVKYEDPLTIPDKSNFKSLKVLHNDLKPLDNINIFGKKRTISLFGWHPGWLGTYIILSIIFSIGLRKWLKIY
tara:strand:- start:40037 stop:40822 length:786 start_codon:yes stop_codon:yes gene_type:complete